MLQQRAMPPLGLALALFFAAFPAAGQERSADDPLPVGAGAVSVHSLLELDVHTADAANLGQVYDLVADPRDGTLTLLVVQRDSDVFGIDFPFVGTRAAIPWEDVTIQDSPRLFRVELTLGEVEALPEWEGERAEGAMMGAAPIGERPDQEPMTAD